MFHLKVHSSDSLTWGGRNAIYQLKQKTLLVTKSITILKINKPTLLKFTSGAVRLLSDIVNFINWKNKNFWEGIPIIEEKFQHEQHPKAHENFYKLSVDIKLSIHPT